MAFETAFRTEVGNSAKGRNEDAFEVRWPAGTDLMDRDGILLAVADGVGGESCGDEASRIAVETLTQAYGEAQGRVPAALRLMDAFTKANAGVYAASRKAGHWGMCTTLAAAIVFPTHAVFANVGDSRGYVIPSHGPARQVTVDHSEVQEMVAAGMLTPQDAETAANRNVITRVVGSHSSVQVDIFNVQLAPGDTVLLCTDGLVTAVNDTEIAGAMQGHPLESAVDCLVELAKGLKGHDN
ncbi:MAG: protein phosphatase 2C domain-containing protein, partial [Desulfobacterales bacterium]|nr:protein phosphatase 2C domain-containing protein [Desulfobacterales bacterium]